MPIRILVFAGLKWSTGKVHREVFRRMTKNFEVRYQDTYWFDQPSLDRDVAWCDILFSTLNWGPALDRMFKDPAVRKKMFFLCHGTPEIPGDVEYSQDFQYGVTSDAILPYVLEKTTIRHAYVMPNGVDMTLYTRIHRSGELRTLGWVGDYTAVCKRFDMFQPIISGTGLTPKATTSSTPIPADKMDEWYSDVDMLVVLSGPDQWAETGPLPPFEAVACGIPVVGTRVGNSRKIPGPKFDTVEEAVSIINDLKARPDAVRELARHQYAFVVANFSYDALAPMWERALTRCYSARNEKVDGDA
jgi:hypothetical protein